MDLSQGCDQGSGLAAEAADFTFQEVELVAHLGVKERPLRESFELGDFGSSRHSQNSPITPGKSSDEEAEPCQHIALERVQQPGRPRVLLKIERCEVGAINHFR